MCVREREWVCERQCVCVCVYHINSQNINPLHNTLTGDGYPGGPAGIIGLYRTGPACCGRGGMPGRCMRGYPPLTGCGCIIMWGG